MCSVSLYSVFESDLSVEDVSEWQHTAQSFPHWHFKHVDLYAGHQP